MIYSSDLTEEQWELIEPYFDTGNYGKYRTHDKKHLVNAVFYIIKTGSQWHLLPQDFPPYKTVYSFYKRAKDKGIWEKTMKGLIEKSRVKIGRKAQPSYSLIDSQSVKTTSHAIDRGIDGGKKNKGS